MKTPALVMLATAACAVRAAAGAECTVAQINQISAIEMSADAQGVCSKYNYASMSPEVLEQMCYDTACITVIVNAAPLFPSCSISGFYVKSMAASIQSNCETIIALGTGVPTTSTPTTTSPPTTRTSTPTTRTPPSTTTSSLFTPTPTSRKPTPTPAEPPTEPTPTPTATSASNTIASVSPTQPGTSGMSSSANSQQQHASTALVATALVALVFTAFA